MSALLLLKRQKLPYVNKHHLQLIYLIIVNNISYVGYIFYFKANCCLEAYTLNKFFVDYAFKLADTQNIDEDQAVVRKYFSFIFMYLK